ncbi:MAG: DUF1759 domain-containing protein, partial [Nitrosopumilus sp.]|nr:DUF1759 domain-containing protein [Nitrosopumilus sp.]
MKGDALRAVEGISLSNANYTTCVDLLKSRFGEKDNIINAYMEALMKLPNTTNDVKKLRRFFDSLEAYV